MLLERSFYGHSASSRCLVGSDRTHSSNPSVQASRWQTTPIRPGLSDGHRIRTPKWHLLANAATGDGCGSGMTCWRRLRDWQRAGIWDLIHFVVLNWLSRYGQIDWSQAVVDSRSVRAVFGGTQTGPNPTDRAKLGSDRHLICDGQGTPLAIQLTWANRNDSQQALPLVDAIPPLLGARGRPRIPSGLRAWRPRI